MPNNIVFISGGNRGIGFEFVRQLAERGDEVIAGYRKASTSGKLLKIAEEKDNVQALRAEVTDQYDVKNLKDFISGKYGRLDMIINNAGVNIKYSTPLDEVEPEDIMENFRINIIGPFLAGKILRSLLAKSGNPKLINISSQMGSISNSSRSSGDAAPYRISKAALNMLAKSQSIVYQKDNIITIALHPGWVRTDMGGPGAPLEALEAVASMLHVIDNLESKDNGAFMAYDGKLLDY